MKKTITILALLVVVGGIAWVWKGNNTKTDLPPGDTSPTVSAPVVENTKVSDKLSEYKNEELGFSVKYPSVWTIKDQDGVVTLSIPLPKSDTSTVSKLESKISFAPGKCAFPPVTTIKDRGTLKTDVVTFNYISMANSVQGKSYFDKMYSLQKDSVCYFFSLSTITDSPAAKGLKGSELTKMNNNNKAVIDGTNEAFSAMVKSFSYVVSKEGQDEATVRPGTPVKK